MVCSECKQVHACTVTLVVTDPGLLRPRDSPGKNTGVGCRAFLQGIFLTRVEPASLTAGRFFTASVSREALNEYKQP